MGSSRSRLTTRSSPPQSFFVGHELSLLACRLPLTILAAQCHIVCVMSLVGVRRSDVRSVVGFGRCRFRHHEESKPGRVSFHARTATLAS